MVPATEGCSVGQSPAYISRRRERRVGGGFLPNKVAHSYKRVLVVSCYFPHELLEGVFGRRDRKSTDTTTFCNGNLSSFFLVYAIVVPRQIHSLHSKEFQEVVVPPRTWNEQISLFAATVILSSTIDNDNIFFLVSFLPDPQRDAGD